MQSSGHARLAHPKGTTRLQSCCRDIVGLYFVQISPCQRLNQSHGLDQSVTLNLLNLKPHNLLRAIPDNLGS